MSITWHRVSKASPCPICTRDEFCQVAEDGSVIMCRWAHVSESASGGRPKVDKTGVPYTIFARGASATGPSSYTGDVPEDAPEPTVVKHEYTIAEPGHLDTVYRLLLEESQLSPFHEQSLANRGFTRTEIDRLGYKTLPDADQVTGFSKVFVQRFRATLLTVPGFSVREWVDATGSEKSCLAVDGPPSCMLPVRDRYGRIIRLQLDVDRESPKYLPFTSYRPRGSKATQATHVPLHDGAITYAIRLVGGIYKADIATLRTHVLTLAAPSEYGYATCLDDVTALDPAIVSIAPDADVRSNPRVAAAFAHGCLVYQSHAFTVVIETWPAEFGKGIDDVIANGHECDIAVLQGARVWEFVRDVLASSAAPPNPAVEARLALAQLGDEPDPTVVFRPAVINGLAQLDPTTAEFRTLHGQLGDVLGKGELKTLDKAIKQERDRLQEVGKQQRLAEFEASGRRIFPRVSDAALSLVVIDDLTPVGGTRTNPDLLKCVRGQLYGFRPRPKGIWEKLADAAAINLVATYDGSPIGGLDGELLSISAGKARGVLDLVKANRKDDTFFDAPKIGIAFSNGFLVPDLVTGEMKLEPHNAGNKVRWGFDFEYVSGLLPTKYLAFLVRTCEGQDPYEKANTIQCLTQHLGACLMGIATRFEIALFLDGASGTGNSTILNIHRRVMPPGFVSSVLPHAMDEDFSLANLEGALLNVADDLPKRELIDLGRLKSVVTGGWIEAGKKYEQNHGFRVVAGHLFACNGLPRIPEAAGMRRRSAILKFTSIVPEEVVDRWLDETIVNEERAQIVSFALDGLSAAIRRNKLVVPEASHARVTEWLGEADTVERFYEDQLTVLSAELRQDVARQRWWPRAVADVYAAYSSWCRDRGHLPFGEGTFGKKLRTMLGISAVEWKAPPYHRRDGYHYPVLLQSHRGMVEDDAETTQIVNDLEQKGAWN